jgi:hypothetical protein
LGIVCTSCHCTARPRRRPPARLNLAETHRPPHRTTGRKENVATDSQTTRRREKKKVPHNHAPPQRTRARTPTPLHALHALHVTLTCNQVQARSEPRQTRRGERRTRGTHTHTHTHTPTHPRTHTPTTERLTCHRRAERRETAKRRSGQRATDAETRATDKRHNREAERGTYDRPSRRLE